MSNPVIKVEHLSKCYRIGEDDQKADTLFGQVVKAVKTPITNFKKIASLSRSSGNDPSAFFALRDISFEVSQGEILGIIGQNGAGKSTLLKILSQITTPSAGKVTIHGHLSALLEVGTGFHPELTGRENIYMNGTILGMRKKEIDKKLDDIIAFSGIEKHIDTPVKFYSSGMKVRLGFSVAAYLDPEILVIDEVLAVGDLEFQRRCIGKINEVAQGGKTILFVSHDMAAIQSLCRECILLKNGEIAVKSDTSKVVSEYLSNIAYDTPVSLTEVKNRPGDGRARLINYHFGSEIDNYQSSKSNGLLCGVPGTIDLTIVNYTDSTIKRAVFALGILDSLGKVLALIDNSFLGIEIDLDPGENIIRFNISKIMIVSGTYYLRFWCADHFDTVMDYTNNMLQKFVIYPSDIWGTGKTYNKERFGQFILEATIKKISY